MLTCGAFTLACSQRTRPDAPGPASQSMSSRSFERVAIAVLGVSESLHLTMERKKGYSTIVLVRMARNGLSARMLDSIGPIPTDPERVRQLLTSFDVWELNAPNSRGAACTTYRGERQCKLTVNDYSVVMEVVRRRNTRVQRYTGLEQDTSLSAPRRRSARALGDFIFAWAREAEVAVSAR